MKTTEENNRMIAEFIGRCGKRNKCLYWVNVKSIGWVKIEEMEFHSSWDWITPVVEKIANIKGFYNVKHDLHDLKINASKEDVYNACVSFIEWYNEQNK